MNGFGFMGGDFDRGETFGGPSPGGYQGPSPSDYDPGHDPSSRDFDWNDPSVAPPGNLFGPGGLPGGGASPQPWGDPSFHSLRLADMFSDAMKGISPPERPAAQGVIPGYEWQDPNRLAEMMTDYFRANPFPEVKGIQEQEFWGTHPFGFAGTRWAQTGTQFDPWTRSPYADPAFRNAFPPNPLIDPRMNIYDLDGGARLERSLLDTLEGIVGLRSI